MIALLFYWIFLFIVLLPAGIFVKQLFRFKTENICLIILLGLLYLAFGFSLAAFVLPLGKSTLLFFLITNVVTSYIYRVETARIINKAYFNLKSLSSFSKIILLILSLGALLKSAQLPFIIDNESYYIQTIKWLNQYGFVKGLGNLHLFFAQTSSWHVLQAGLNLNFLYDRINDINGFVFVVCTAYYLTEAEKHLRAWQLHWIGLMPVFSVLYFQFIDTPSPDLPLLLITPILFHLFLKEKNEEDNFKVATLLFLLLVFIKITIAPLGLMFLFLFYRKPKRIYFFLSVAFPIALLWIAKNCIINGYPLYPLTLASTNFDWTMPKHLIDGVNAGANKHVFGTGDTTQMSRFSHWISRGGLAGIFNKLATLLLVILPFFKIVRHDKRYRFIYVAFLIHILILFFTSPQYRFFLPVLLFFLAVLFAFAINYIKNYKKLYYSILSFATVITLIIFVSFSKSALTDNKLHQQTNSVKLCHLLIPEPVSRFDTLSFEHKKLYNLDYYSPETNFFFYGTANGDLPCVNDKQLRYFEKKYKVVPQLRTDNLKDGFYSWPVPVKD